MSEVDIMNDGVREQFKKNLMKMREEAIEKVEMLRKDVSSHKEVGSDQLDQAAGIEERDRFMAEINRELASLKQIEFAIKNFEDFGFCLDCGEEIAPRRLSINPSITTCIDCQEKNERIARGHARQ